MSFISRNTQITDVADLIKYNKIYCIELCGGPLFEILQFFVIQFGYCYNTSKYIITDIYDQ